MFHVVLGWIGAFLFAICAVPQVVKTWKTKSAGDLSWLFLLFWLLGELLTLFYILVDDYLESITHFPLYINYAFNTVLVLYLVYAKLKFRGRPVQSINSK
jgi:MtN3 and saliva related transmembrane protein